ncbi:hypothetical protein ACFC0D_25000 [Streptomyces sp. NPDC056222]
MTENTDRVVRGNGDAKVMGANRPGQRDDVFVTSATVELAA